MVLEASSAPWPCLHVEKESGRFAVAMATELLSGRLDSSVITRERERNRLCGRRKSVSKNILDERKNWARKWKVVKEWEWSGRGGWRVKKNESKGKEKWARVRLREGERASVGRKQLYLHEAYLGSRLQNNGRKRVHGTFPSERACVPLIQGLVAPAPPCGQQRRHSLSGRRGRAGHRQAAGCTSTHLMIESSVQQISTANFTFTFLLLMQRGFKRPAYLF